MKTTYTPLRPKPVLTYPISDKQVMADYVAHHFFIEGNPAGFDPVVSRCVYDTPSGGCAIGCMLPPDFRATIGKAAFSFSPAFDDVCNLEKGVAQLRSATLEKFAPCVEEFGTSLQQWHDMYRDDLRSNISFHYFKRHIFNEGLEMPIAEVVPL